ncbi:MAG TPA: P-loop NTPase [Kofleriaceae bacterium]|jgi:flagellar biosynthesis protein FlhG|nr:P-loop NTPase [Kofleriaceae bacterium]
MARKKPVPRIVVIAGGKGGVGKSTIAANLSLAIGRLGSRVTLIDCDLGAANLHTMLGVVRPAVGLADFFDQKISLEEACVGVGMPTVALIPGTSRPGAANLSAVDKARLLRGMARLDTDCIVIDVGAGTSFNVVDLVAVADIKLFVLTPQLPSIHNAYALLKACVHRVMRKLAADETGQALIDSALGQETKARSVGQLIEVLRPLEPALAYRIEDELSRFGIGLIGNQLNSDADLSVLHRISTMVHEQLKVTAPVLAAIRRGSGLGGGLKAGVGTIVDRSDPSHAIFRALAARILEIDLAQLRGEVRVKQEKTMPIWIQRELDTVH